MKRNFRSCYVVDVKIDDKSVYLTDSSRVCYTIDLTDSKIADQFTAWLKSTFLKGISQHLTVFEYVNVGEHPDIEYKILKIFTNESLPNS